MIKILSYEELERTDIFARKEDAVSVETAVADILAQVKEKGDEALFRYCEQFDHAKLEQLAVTQAETDEALSLVEPEFLRILERAAKNIRAYHENQMRTGFEIKPQEGVVMGQLVLPMENVGLYVPGGSAAYPSTVLMDSIPAKIAGCPNLVITTPPNAEGKINPYILAAASVAKVDQIYKVGGAQAIAALAFGTETIPKVDKIVGPGNAFVAEAKKQVFGAVSIDMIAGPSEILIISDGKTDPAWTAADLLSQAEHDKNASAVLLTDCAAFAKAVQAEVAAQLAVLERSEIAATSIEKDRKSVV